MSKTSTADVQDTETDDANTIEDDWTISRDLQGMALVLWLAGEQLDDPDPVRVAKWVSRLQAEGILE
ncbi:hypothetical protein SAMN06269185_3347 [Natronoarchaeum philippinense]|uniref:Uncharacterized protein n=1 Tax=Natronoarchaeum philippinense TaxID=558529 RepID=A0A285P9G1_NATPI|nr:hypothetical protein [Natronoarchaeum philippinense]SNZ18364.1 hypothetical protein SAMN06269185_3347 [Natronoarchaeum philippinense]